MMLGIIKCQDVIDDKCKKTINQRILGKTKFKLVLEEKGEKMSRSKGRNTKLPKKVAGRGNEQK